MKNWKEQLAALLEAGAKPSYDQLEIALQCALQERNQYESTVKDMATWLGRMTTARLHSDGSELPTVMDEFIAARVKIQIRTEDGVTSIASPQSPATH